MKKRRNERRIWRGDRQNPVPKSNRWNFLLNQSPQHPSEWVVEVGTKHTSTLGQEVTENRENNFLSANLRLVARRQSSNISANPKIDYLIIWNPSSTIESRSDPQTRRYAPGPKVQIKNVQLGNIIMWKSDQQCTWGEWWLESKVVTSRNGYFRENSKKLRSLRSRSPKAL